MAFVRDSDGRWHDDERGIADATLISSRDSNRIKLSDANGKKIAEAWFLTNCRDVTEDDLAQYGLDRIDRITVWHFDKGDAYREVPGYGKLADIIIEFIAAFEADWPNRIMNGHGKIFVAEASFDSKNWEDH